MEQHAIVCANIAEIIRNRSKTGQLIDDDGIIAELTRLEMPELELGFDNHLLRALLDQVVNEHSDLRKVSNRSGLAYYHSVQSLTESYADILVWKTESPVRVMAEMVRKDSELYPRPVPVESFQGPPFELTAEEIQECLAAMGQQEECGDIALITTSVGTQFLYSTRYMDPDHASMMAEWLEVGQADNP